MAMRSGPLAVAIAVATGIAVVPWLERLGATPWLIGLAVVAAAVRWRRGGVLLLAAGFALGAVRGTRPAPVVPPGVVADDRGVDRVVGVVRGPVLHGPLGDGARLDTGDAAIWVWTEERLVPGHRVEVTGRVRVPRGLQNPATPDRRDAMWARGAALELTARTIERLGDDAGLADRVWRWADRTQARWSRDIAQAGGDPAGTAALRGITVGDRSAVPPELDQRWRTTGIFHVLSVSGLHLAVVAGLAFGALRRLLAASPWGGRIRPARWAAVPAIALAIAYTLVTGAQLATLRALVVIAIVLLAQGLDRPVRLVDALGVAAIAILAWRPADLWDPSFQLSFVAALTLALRPASPHGAGVRGWLVRGVATSVWVAITTAPLTAYHFQQVAVGGVIGNLVLTPVIELAALPLGLAGVVLGLPPVIAAAAWIVGVADRGAGLLAEITPVGHAAVAGTTTMAILVGLSLWIATRPRGVGGGLAWLALCAGWWLGRMPPPDGALRVTFLDVGQGDAALLELPDGAVWLVDAGGNPGARDLARAAAPGRVIDRVLAACGHRRIDLAIVSHPHPDHYLGLAGIAAPIDEVWTAAVPDDTAPDARITGATPGETATSGEAATSRKAGTSDQASSSDLAGNRLAAATDTGPSIAGWSPWIALPRFAAVAEALTRRGTRVVHPPLGIARRTAGVELMVWAPRYQASPDAPVVCAADPVRSVNDNSLVVAVRYRGRTILFAGDLEAEGEDHLIAAGFGRADVVKVPHHGSRTSSTAAFVDATRPEVAVISCGVNNAFGFPAPEVIERWREAGTAVARTDHDGAITVTIDHRGALSLDR